MNIGRMMEFSRQLVELDGRFRVAKRLNNVASRIQEIVTAPQEVQHQSNALASVEELRKALADLNGEFSDSLRDFLHETGGNEFFLEGMADVIDNHIRSSGITAAVAKTFVDQLAARRSKYVESLKAADNTLKALKFKEYGIPEGQAEVSFKIPRRLIDNKPSKLAEELWFVDLTVNIFSEAVTGEKQEGELAQLASSDPTVVVTTAVQVAAGLALSVKLLVDAYAKYVSILKMKEPLKAIDMSAEVLKELDGKADKKLEQAIEAIVEKVLAKKAQGRVAELRNGLRYILKSMVAKFEWGFKVEVRFLPTNREGLNEEQAAAAKKKDEELMSLQRVVFPELPEKPLLQLPKRPRGVKPDGERKTKGGGGKRTRRNGRTRNGGGAGGEVENGVSGDGEELEIDGESAQA